LSVIVIEPISSKNTSLFKYVRLRALQESPGAFGSTYAKEILLHDSDWIKRVERWNGEVGAGFLALDEGTPCGIAGSILDQTDATRAAALHLDGADTSPAGHRSSAGERGYGLGRTSQCSNLAVDGHEQ
jgi:hypothetical protein